MAGVVCAPICNRGWRGGRGAVCRAAVVAGRYDLKSGTAEAMFADEVLGLYDCGGDWSGNARSERAVDQRGAFFEQFFWAANWPSSSRETRKFSPARTPESRCSRPTFRGF